jgi:hypothetical protein
VAEIFATREDVAIQLQLAVNGDEGLEIYDVSVLTGLTGDKYLVILVSK